MDFERLAEFTSVAQNGSIKKAALELGISSATLSARIIRLEEHLGAPLFVRSGAAVTLTSAGQQLLPSAIEILSNYQKIRGEVQTVQAHTYRHLRIAVCGTNLPLYLGPFLDRLNIANPDLQIELIDDSRYSITDGLLSGAVDVYFAPVMDDFRPEALSRNPFAASAQFVVMPRNHRLAERSMISIRELDGESFILYPKTSESAIRDFQLRNLNASGIRCSVYDSETSPIFHKLLVPVGKGLLLRPSPMIDLPPNTVAVPVSDLKYPAVPCFFYDKNTQRVDVLAFARDFFQFIKEASRHEHKQTL